MTFRSIDLTSHTHTSEMKLDLFCQDMKDLEFIDKTDFFKVSHQYLAKLRFLGYVLPVVDDLVWYKSQCTSEVGFIIEINKYC